MSIPLRAHDRCSQKSHSHDDCCQVTFGYPWLLRGFPFIGRQFHGTHLFRLPVEVKTLIRLTRSERSHSYPFFPLSLGIRADSSSEKQRPQSLTLHACGLSRAVCSLLRSGYGKPHDCMSKPRSLCVLSSTRVPIGSNPNSLLVHFSCSQLRM